MHPKRFALIGGIVMLVFGALALVPNLSDFPFNLPSLTVDASYGLFLGLFPMNIFNKLALIAFGASGIAAASARATNLPLSISFSRWVFYAMGVLTVLGIFPQTNTLFGYWPLFGNEIWLHGVLALTGAYFGYVLTSKVPEQPRTRFHRRISPNRL